MNDFVDDMFDLFVIKFIFCVIVVDWFVDKFFFC